MDEQKRLERREKERENAAEHGQSGFASNVVRGLGDEEGMPEAPPALHPGALADVFQAPDKNTSSSFDMGGDMDEDEEEEEEKALDLPNYAPETECYTTFRVNAAVDPKDVLQMVASLLNGMGGDTIIKESKMKGSVSTSLGKVHVTAQIFKDEKNNVVEFRKRRGDGEQFRALYWEVRSKMGKVAVTEKKESTEEEKAQ